MIKIPTSISCSTGREPSTEKQTIDASTMAPVPQLVPRVGACTRSKKLPNRRVPTAPRESQPSANQQQECCQQSRPARQVHGIGHSITSPRMRNFASATLETKPTTARIRAASK